MLSRVADALYWMGRYAERAEHAARVLNVAQNMQLDLVEVQPGGASSHWHETLEALAMPMLTLEHLVLDEQEATSVVASLSRARENGRQVRDIISAEMWEELNSAYWALREAAQAENRAADLVDALADVVSNCFAFAGVTDGTMPRGEGWLFIKLGTFVERADKVARLVRTRAKNLSSENTEIAAGSDDNLVWLSLLRACSALEAYRKMHPTRLDPKQVFEFLMFDREFPHAMRYAIAAIADFAGRLASITGERGRAVERAFGKLESRVRYAEIDEAVDHGLDLFLGDVMLDLGSAGLILQRTYFLH